MSSLEEYVFYIFLVKTINIESIHQTQKFKKYIPKNLLHYIEGFEKPFIETSICPFIIPDT